MTIMNVDVDTEDEVNLIKDVRARSNACHKCGEMGHFQRDCKYNGDKPMDGQQGQERSFDSYDPVVGKWMTNLVATTPITAKAMKSLCTKLNRQKDLKRTYRQRYKDLQAVLTTTTDSPTTMPSPVIVTSSKVATKPPVTKLLWKDKVRESMIKERLSPLSKERKMLSKQPPMLPQQLALLLTQEAI